jgi:uncharacterized protein YbjT (DUF2867 family)
VSVPPRDVFVTGGSGYVGVALIRKLLERGHRVRALVRASSAARIPAGAETVVGDALAAESIASALKSGETIVQLVGTPHPSPAKAAEFRRVDLASLRAAVEAARRSPPHPFVYVSVAQPAPVMRDYVDARAEGEAALARAGLTATILRPWYVLGPGHRWPVLLLPIYAIARLVPSLRAGALRLGLVTLEQMVAALVHAIESPPTDGTIRMVEVPAIRAGG